MISKRILKEAYEIFEAFKKENDFKELNKIRRRNTEKNFVYCCICNDDDVSHVYDFGEYHRFGYFGVCGKCIKQYYCKEPEQLRECSGETSLSLRFRILERDGFKCVYCGRKPQKGNDVELQIDHIYPKSKGGTDLPDNLVTACRECNLGKSDYILKNRR